MKNIDYQIKILIREIRRTQEYKDYRQSLEEIKRQPEVFQRLNHYRRAALNLQINMNLEMAFYDANRIRKEFADILSIPCVVTFLRAEDNICQMLSQTTNDITNSLDLDIDFLDE